MEEVEDMDNKAVEVPTAVEAATTAVVVAVTMEEEAVIIMGVAVNMAEIDRIMDITGAAANMVETKEVTTGAVAEVNNDQCVFLLDKKQMNRFALQRLLHLYIANHNVMLIDREIAVLT